jgi:hypothetical protein
MSLEGQTNDEVIYLERIIKKSMSLEGQTNELIRTLFIALK